MNITTPQPIGDNPPKPRPSGPSAPPPPRMSVVVALALVPTLAALAGIAGGVLFGVTS